MKSHPNHHIHLLGHLSLAMLGVALSLTGLLINSQGTSAQVPTVFQGAFAGRDTRQTDLHWNYGENNFEGLIFWGNHKTLPSPVTVNINGDIKSCSKQVRGLYYNSARGQVLRPLDQDSLNALREIDSSYNNLEDVEGGLYIGCGEGNTTNVFGQVTHTINGLERKLVAGVDIQTSTNTYTHQFADSLTFNNAQAGGYIVDSIGGVASVNGVAPGYASTPTQPTEPSNNPPQLLTDEQAGICEIDRDCSDSYYDLICGTCDGQPHNAADDEEKTILIDSPIDFMKQVGEVMKSMTCDISEELVRAYVFAYDVGITTVPKICDADMMGPLRRNQLSKFISVFAIELLDKQVTVQDACTFTDMANQSNEFKLFATLSCKLGFMGLNRDGTANTTFNPDAIVTRAEFGAAFSRMLYGSIHNTPENDPRPWYQAHLQALQADGIMTQINNPMMQEVRGYVMLMMQRAYTLLNK